MNKKETAQVFIEDKYTLFISTRATFLRIVTCSVGFNVMNKLANFDA